MDVAVFGGGPAGLAAALALRQRGLRVALYDAQRPPIDKACGEGLMPEAVRLLREFGLALDERDGASLVGISFHNAYGSAYARFSGDPGLGVRRTHLQEQMARRAAEVGVALHWGAVVQAWGGGSFASAGVRIAADFFVIADGLRSSLAPASGFREPRCHSTRYASRQQFQRPPWIDLVEVHWGREEQLYITPLGREEIGIALLTSRPGRRVCDALVDFPVVARRIAGAAPTSKMRGAVTQTRSRRQVIRGNVAVLGDASGSVDALTGEGLLSAFRQANALADAIAAGEPTRYAAAHRRMAKTSQCMARILLLLDRHPGLERRFVTRMAERPENFAALLRMHLAAQSGLEFAWSAATALLFGKRGAVNSKIAEAAPGGSPWMPYATKAHRERGL
ncbi:MAG TPA: FAD-dependent monooxygenase [Acidobacteriaceae bacterium]|nr:FAD-dependent monooxygenase [Acidobacteriaceae bacterium]